MSTLSATSALVDIYAAPSELFSKLREHKKVTWIALTLMLVLTVASIMWFYSGMSDQWLVNQQLQQMTFESANEQAQVENYLRENAQHTGTLGAIFSVIFMLLMLSALALYFKIVGYQHEQATYGDWFAFSVWTQMPTLLHMLGFIALMIVAGGGDLPINLPNYASVNQLLLNLPVHNSWFQLTEALNLFFIWNIVIGAKGLMQWCKMPVVKASIFSALPYIAVFGIWAAFV